MWHALSLFLVNFPATFLNPLKRSFPSQNARAASSGAGLMSKKSRSVAKSNPGWFPKGRSGNLNGRPRASRVSRGSGFEVLVEKTLSVADDRGGTREITLKEALQQRTYQDALPSMSRGCLKPNTLR